MLRKVMLMVYSGGRWHNSKVFLHHDIFITFQNAARINNQENSIMLFDKLGVSEVSLRINGHQEPSEDILLNFDQNHVARAYHRLMTFMGRDQNVDTGLQISQLDFIRLYPIITFRWNIWINIDSK
jgi:hypothetical protein